MEGFEIVAILVYIIIAGLIGLSRYIQGGSQDDDTSTDAPEAPRPVSEPTPLPRPGRVEPQRYESPYQRPTQSQPRTPQTPQYDYESPYRRIPKPQPQPESAPKPEDDPLKPMRDMLKEIFGADEPEIVEERPQKRLKKRRKPKPVEETPQQSVLEEMLKPVRLEEKVPAPVAKNPFLERLVKEAEDNPMRSAVIFSEILKRPHAIRTSPMLWSRDR